PGARWHALVRPGGLAALATARVILGHYLVALLIAILELLYGLYALAVRVRSWHALVRMIGASALTGAAGALLCLPWLLRIREGQLLRLGSYFIANNIGVGTGNDQSPQQVEWALGHGLLPLAVLGIVWIVARRRWMGLLFPAWAIVAWIAANPFLIGLNGAGIVSSFAVILAAYLVLCPLAGAGLVAAGEGLHWLLAHSWFKPRRFVPWLQALLVAGIVAWGVRYQAGIVDPQYQLLTPADVAAATWVREHVPPDARIFVNSFPAYADAVYVGTDGGWWLPLLTGRRTNLDPISYGFEAAEEPEYMQRVIERNRAVLDHPVDSVEAVAALKAGGYAYLYDGPAANPPAEYLDPARLDASPLYEPVYSAGGARIWRIR
ncbi:MAG: hypothetical protein N2378_12665, partial [Chloroflexaceae bacterium]|nr:hypothetical protein [Chloroflexaceae bacterium]